MRRLVPRAFVPALVGVDSQPRAKIGDRSDLHADSGQRARHQPGGAGESGATPGTGLVDFASLFTVLHEAAFTGPVEILTEYVYDGVNLNSTFWADSPALTLTRQQLFTTIAASLATYQGYATAAGWTIAQQDTADPA